MEIKEIHIWEYISEIVNNNPIFNLISLFLAITGIILAVYFYLKSKKTEYLRMQSER